MFHDHAVCICVCMCDHRYISYDFKYLTFVSQRPIDFNFEIPHVIDCVV